VTSGIRISTFLEIRQEGTSRFYLRFKWTSAFKDFFSYICCTKSYANVYLLYDKMNIYVRNYLCIVWLAAMSSALPASQPNHPRKKLKLMVIEFDLYGRIQMKYEECSTSGRIQKFYTVRLQN